MGTELAKGSDLEMALRHVEGRAPRTTEAYRAQMAAFCESGHRVTVDGFRAYIEELKGRVSASTVNQAIAAGRKAFLQAAETLGLDAKRGGNHPGRARGDPHRQEGTPGSPHGHH